MLGLFSKPKCPRCNGPINATGYSFPFPQWKCPNCTQTNKMKREIDELKKLISEQKAKECDASKAK